MPGVHGPSAVGDRGATAMWARLAGVFLAVLLLACPALQARAQVDAGTAQSEAVELEVKAAYLYKFANYVDWPPEAFRDSTQPVVIGVMGATELVDELQRIVRGKSVRGRGFVVQRLQPGDDLRNLHILFVGPLNRDTAAVLAATEGQHVLTVSDSKRVFASGSMVNLVKVGDRLRFEVALAPVQRSRLRLSALMLTAAIRVDRGAR